MPPDVFLALISSGIALVASLVYFVLEDDAPVERDGPLLPFCLPPKRQAQPPPLPRAGARAPGCTCTVNLSTAELHSILTLKPAGDEWVVTLDTVPWADMPALDVKSDGSVTGLVHDLRWQRRAGLARASSRTWKQKPGRA